MNFGISFSPLVHANVVWAAVAIAFVIAMLLVFSRNRGALTRAVALALFVLALANPSITNEDREPLTSVAVVIVDKSPSQALSDRTAQTKAARAALAERLGRVAELEVRFVEAGEADGETDGTRLFAALAAALADVPPDRVAGVIIVADGRVHDVPAEVAALGFTAPVHALIAGHENERDRRVELVRAALRHRRAVATSSSTSTTTAAHPAARSFRSGATARPSTTRPSASAPMTASTCGSRTPGRRSSRSRRQPDRPSSPWPTTGRSS